MNRLRYHDDYQYLPNAYLSLLKAEQLERLIEIIEARIESRKAELESIKKRYVDLRSKA
jgi:hypothetical protein